MNISPSACTIRKINHNLPLDSHWLHEAKCMGGVRRAYTRALIRYARLLQHHVIPRLLHPHLLDGAVSRVQLGRRRDFHIRRCLTWYTVDRSARYAPIPRNSNITSPGDARTQN